MGGKAEHAGKEVGLRIRRFPRPIRTRPVQVSSPPFFDDLIYHNFNLVTKKPIYKNAMPLVNLINNKDTFVGSELSTIHINNSLGAP